MSEKDGERPLSQRQVIYRVTNEEYETLVRIADLLHKNGSLKVNNVNALAKAACFTQINIFLGFEAKDKAFKEWLEKEAVQKKGLELNRSPIQGYNLQAL